MIHSAMVLHGVARRVCHLPLALQSFLVNLLAYCQSVLPFQWCAGLLTACSYSLTALVHFKHARVLPPTPRRSTLQQQDLLHITNSMELPCCTPVQPNGLPILCPDGDVMVPPNACFKCSACYWKTGEATERFSLAEFSNHLRICEHVKAWEAEQNTSSSATVSIKNGEMATTCMAGKQLHGNNEDEDDDDDNNSLLTDESIPTPQQVRPDVWDKPVLLTNGSILSPPDVAVAHICAACYWKTGKMRLILSPGYCNHIRQCPNVTAWMEEKEARQKAEIRMNGGMAHGGKKLHAEDIPTKQSPRMPEQPVAPTRNNDRRNARKRPVRVCNAVCAPIIHFNSTFVCDSRWRAWKRMKRTMANQEQ